MGKAPLSQMLVYIDDMLGDLRFNKHLDALFTRGRHLGISTFLTSQVIRGASSTLRKQIDILVCFRLNQTEYNAVREEVIGADISAEEFDERTWRTKLTFWGAQLVYTLFSIVPCAAISRNQARKARGAVQRGLGAGRRSSNLGDLQVPLGIEIRAA